MAFTRLRADDALTKETFKNSGNLKREQNTQKGGFGQKLTLTAPPYSFTEVVLS